MDGHREASDERLLQTLRQQVELILSATKTETSVVITLVRPAGEAVPGTVLVLPPECEGTADVIMDAIGQLHNSANALAGQLLASIAEAEKDLSRRIEEVERAEGQATTARQP